MKYKTDYDIKDLSSMSFVECVKFFIKALVLIPTLLILHFHNSNICKLSALIVLINVLLNLMYMVASFCETYIYEHNALSMHYGAFFIISLIITSTIVLLVYGIINSE